VAARGSRISCNDPIYGCAGWPGKDGLRLRRTAWPVVVAERGRWISRNDPIRGCAGRPGQDGLRLRRTAWPAMMTGRGMQISRNDPIGGCAGRPGQNGLGPRGTAWPALMAGRGRRISGNDPVRWYADRSGRDGLGPRGTALACGGGRARNGDSAQRPYTRACESVGPRWRGSSRDSPRNDPIRGCAGRPSRDDLGPRGTARLAGVVGRGIRVSRKDPMRGVRVGWAGMAGMAGGTRGSAESRKNPTQLSGRRIGAG